MAVVARWRRILKSRNESSIATPTTIGYRRHWTLREEQLLILLHESGQSWNEIADNFPDCTVTKCTSHWYRLLHPPIAERWKEWEERLLVSGYYAGLTWEEIAKSIPGRTRKSVSRHWGLYFWLPQQDNPWTSEELTILAHLRAEGSAWDQISQKIPEHRSNACRTQWYKETDGVQDRSHRRWDRWSAEETNTLISLYKTIGPRWEEIWKHLPGRTADSCHTQLHKIRRNENGGGNAPSEFWKDCFLGKSHTRTTIPATYSELTH